jgi:hypothetical protein
MVAPRFSHAADKAAQEHKKDQQRNAPPAANVNRYDKKGEVSISKPPRLKNVD